MNIQKIGVILGGPSNEREVSIRSGKAVANALRRRGYQVVEIGENGSIEQGILTSGIDIAFIALHGRYGEDGTIQQFLEDSGIPYTGSDPLASKFALDKSVSKVIFRDAGIPTPEYILFELENDSYASIIKKIKSRLAFPVVIKPSSEGSSIGLSLVKKEYQLRNALEEALKYDKKIIIEEYVAGEEITVGILGDAPLAVINIVPKKGHYSYEAKYTKGMTEYIVPAKLDTDVYRNLQFLASSAHMALGCRDMSRVDLRLDKNSEAWVLEVNTIPGFTETSLLPKSANAVGIEFDELCEKILKFSWDRFNNNVKTSK